MNSAYLSMLTMNLSRNKVYCAVAEVDYKNIYKWLLGKGEYEEMCHNWFDVIDAKPIMNYFSAYNTYLCN